MFNVETGRTVFLPYNSASDTEGIGLTGNAGEQKACSTPQHDEDLRILGGTCNVATSTASVGDASGEHRLSNAVIPLGQLFGRRATARPVLYYTTPLVLRAGDALTANVLNVGAEGSATDPGHLVHICEPLDPSDRQQVQIDPLTVYPYWMDISAVLSAAASEQKSVNSTIDQEKDTIVWGASTDLTACNVRAWGADGKQITADWTPIWAVAGFSTGQLSTFLWPRGYLIRRGKRIRFEFRDTAEGAESNGHIFLLCSKIPRQ
jgi:hypothetical protein